MSLTTDELRKQVKAELCEALKFLGRAANLLRHAKEKYYMPDRSKEALDTAEALEQVTASMTEYIDNLLTR